MDPWLLVEWVVKSGILLAVLLTGFAYTTFYERKLAARIQLRVGPNRVGPLGFLQPLADGVKLIFKEELIPSKAYKAVFILAPIITVIPALVIMAVVHGRQVLQAFQPMGLKAPLVLVELGSGDPALAAGLAHISQGTSQLQHT